MATRTITTRIALDGEKEFKAQMSSVNSSLKEIDSELKLSEAQFKGQANSVEALTDKERLLTQAVEQQEEKVRALEQAVEDASEAYGDADKKTDNYRISLNKAKAELLGMQDELKDTRKYLDEAEKSADGMSDSLDEFGKVKIGDGFLDNLKSGFSDLKGIMAGGVVVGGIQQITEAMFDLEESTREYRQIMGQLEASATAAGYATEETAEAYDHLYGVLGDTQSTATTIANLQATGAKQKDLMKIIDACTGAWSKYGDSVPIDQLAENIAMAVTSGEVTGALADIINLGTDELEDFGVALKEDTEANEEYNKAVEEATTKEDLFNIKLGESQTQSERLAAVMDLLSSQDLPDLGQAFRDTNEDIIKVNDAQNNLEEQMGRMGEMVAPAVSALKNFAAEGIKAALDGLDDLLEKAAEWGRTAPTIREKMEEAGLISDKTLTYEAEQKTKNMASALTNNAYTPKTLRDAGSIENGTASLRNERTTNLNVTSQAYIDGEMVYESVNSYAVRDEKAVGR